MNEAGRLGPLKKKHPTPLHKTHTAFPKVTYSHLLGWLCIERKADPQTLGKLLDFGSEVTLISRDPKFYCSLPVRVRAYRGQPVDSILAQIHLMVGSVVILWLFLSSKIYNCNTQTQQMAESQH